MVTPISLNFPRPIVALHQIEVTSRCNLRCQYCTHKTLGREKMDMTRETFARALLHVDYHVNLKLDQDELNLCGIGESTLHENLVEFVEMARRVVGKHTFLNFTTNGLEFTEELAKALVPFMSASTGHRPGVFVSFHRPEKAGPAYNIAKRYGLLANVSVDPMLSAINWAGQVDWEVTASPDRECMWLRQGKAIVFSDGSVSTCCMDSAHDGVIGTVWDEPGSLRSKPYDLCASCDQQIGAIGYDQYREGGGKRLPVAKKLVK
jgi:DNA-directed RNA polymerase subunit RPC12/RpoP